MMNSVFVDHEFMNDIFKFHPEILSNFANNPNFEELFQNPDLVDNHGSHSGTQNECNSSPEIPDFPDDCLRYISDILLEDGLDENPATVQDYRALQATEKSLYDALGEEYTYHYIPASEYSPPFSQQNVETPDDGSSKSSGSFHEIASYTTSDSSFESSFGLNQLQFDSISEQILAHSLESKQRSSTSNCDDSRDGLLNPPGGELAKSSVEMPVKGSRKNKSRQSEDKVDDKGRSSKLQVTTNDDFDEMGQYDDALLLCTEYEGKKSMNFPPGALRVRKGRNNRGKKKNIPADHVDLWTLLMQCAQSVSSFDLRTANDLLRQIRQHATPYGSSIQRLAHHVAYGLEARLSGTGSSISTDIVDVKVSGTAFLKAYKLYVSAIPFKRMSYFAANSAIKKLAESATKVHIIDFGIFLGLQWPCFIRGQSERPGGPAKLRITGIDFPQQGFRPSERVDATGRRLAGYCERFGVPFEYHGIAKRWENIQPEDLDIRSDELVVVNCLFRSSTLLDETVDANSPRDGFLRLVRKLKPDLFVHGVVNGTFNAPFFVTRFREALFHYSSVFEVFEATLPREAQERQLIESQVYAKELYNLVACEGAERVQRPESYRLWQVRQVRAGLRQLPLNREHLSICTAMVKANYHNDFLVDDNKQWMLQGWRGRISCALSFWQPS